MHIRELVRRIPASTRWTVNRISTDIVTIVARILAGTIASQSKVSRVRIREFRIRRKAACFTHSRLERRNTGSLTLELYGIRFARHVPQIISERVGARIYCGLGKFHAIVFAIENNVVAELVLLRFAHLKSVGIFIGNVIDVTSLISITRARIVSAHVARLHSHGNIFLHHVRRTARFVKHKASTVFAVIAQNHVATAVTIHPNMLNALLG